MKITILFFVCVLPFTFCDLRIGFYNSSCPTAESIVGEVVQRHFNQDKSFVASLLRLHFHDCFVRGCDASVLIDSTKSSKSEKDAGPNQTLRGFEVIDEAKKLLEQSCPSTVSCADILTLATRDAVSLFGGLNYNIPTGRRDGLISEPNSVSLPGPSLSVSEALKFFTAKGMTLNEMVTLLGGHTIGFTHCSFIRGRIRSVDSFMDPDLGAKLGKFCGTTHSGEPDPLVFLDQSTPFVLDNKFYNQLLLNRGLLEIDQHLASDPETKDLVTHFANDGDSFHRSFANAMIKLGNTDVLVGNEGEIRRNCRVFNNPN